MSSPSAFTSFENSNYWNRSSFQGLDTEAFWVFEHHKWDLTVVLSHPTHPEAWNAFFQWVREKRETTQVIHIPIYESSVLNVETILTRLDTRFEGGERLHARKCKVEKITKKESTEFQYQWHFLPPVPGQFNLGLYNEGDLVAVGTFKKPIHLGLAEAYEFSGELLRWCVKSKFRIPGGLGKVIQAYKEQFQPSNLMTYVDLDWSEGDGFAKLGFERKKETAPFFFNPIEQGKSIKLNEISAPVYARMGSVKMIKSFST